MAKKKAASKKTAKRSAKKAASSKKTARKTTAKKTSSKKTSTRKPAAKKTTAKKAASKKTTAKKITAKKAATKKTTKKKVSAAKPASKTSAEKKSDSGRSSAAKKASASSSDKKAATSKATSSKKPADNKTGNAKTGSPKTGDAKTKDGKPNRKGITIVENRSRKKQAATKYQMPPSTLGSLLNKRRRQPLIPSGPNAPASEFSRFGNDADADGKARKIKSPFKKRELDKFRAILLQKRRELAGDVEEMERGMAALGDRGGDPALDVAEQGSDAYDQSLSIGLAEADRKLIREIDAALKRIDDGIYGICEVTHEPIGVERLKELPWTRLSIEAARSAERRGGGR